MDAETAREMLTEISRLAEGPVAESFVDGDRNPPVFDPETHSVTLPESFKKSVRAVLEAGWDKVGIDEALGGTPMPKALVWALHEHLLGANPAVWMYAGGAGFAQILYHLGTEEQKKWAVMAAERGWGSTMVLTEPDAGSDVGAGRTKAVQQEDGSWHIDGVKRFITSADSGDLFENIFHLVLARPEGAGPGTKGLSLFFVPKFLFDFETGEPGERNGVFVTNVEHKMGLKVSATCELSLRPARRARQGLAGRRGAQRHRADVRGHRAGPNDGRHQGDRHPVDRLPERVGVRQVPRAGCRPDPDDRQDRTAGDHHAPPRRAPVADDPEGIRRGSACAVPLHRDVPGRGGRQGVARRGRRLGSQGQRPDAAGGQGCGLRAGLREAHREPADVRWVRLPAGLPDRAVHPGRQDRLAVRGHHRDPGAGLLLPQDHPRQGCGVGLRVRPDPGVRRQRVRQRAAEDRARAAGQGAGRRPGDGGHADRLPDGGPRGGDQPVQGRPGFGALPDERRRPGHRLVAAASGRGGDARRWTPAPAVPSGPSTRARSRWRRSSRRTSCRCWPAPAR